MGAIPRQSPSRENTKKNFRAQVFGAQHGHDPETANFGPGPLVCGAHSELVRGVAMYSAGRHHPAMPEAMRLERLDSVPGPSSSSYDVSNFIEWAQVPARASAMIPPDARELGSVPGLQMARGDALTGTIAEMRPRRNSSSLATSDYSRAPAQSAPARWRTARSTARRRPPSASRCTRNPSASTLT